MCFQLTLKILRILIFSCLFQKGMIFSSFFSNAVLCLCGQILTVLVFYQFLLYFQQQNSYKNTHTCIYIIEGFKRQRLWTIRSFPEKKQMFISMILCSVSRVFQINSNNNCLIFGRFLQWFYGIFLYNIARKLVSTILVSDKFQTFCIQQLMTSF